MATFNILSSCICRDAFGFQESCPHKVITFLQATSALTWFKYNDKPHSPIDATFFDGISDLSNFQKKCIVHDYNKTVFDQFTSASDFFITDMTEFASMDIAMEIYPDGDKHYFTLSKWFNTAYKKGIKERHPNKIERLDHLALIDDKIIDSTMDNYLAWILSKGYKPEQIILVENKRATSYIDGTLLYNFSGEKQREQINCLLDKIYSSFKAKLPGAHVIKMPIGTLADTNHKWGLTDLHFCSEYYDYLYKCFDLIAANADFHSISNLRDYYSELFLNKRNLCMKNSFEYADGIQLLPDSADISNNSSYVAPKGLPFYDDKDRTNKVGILKRYFEITDIDKNNGSFLFKDASYYVSGDDCVKGVMGNDKYIDSHWKTANKTTLALIKDNSFIVGHDGIKSCAQTQLIQTLKNSEALAGKVVTFSVYARVLALNNTGKGGSIAIINSDDYNKGVFFAKTDFTNSDWQRISVTAKLPEGNQFIGLTVCMRAIAGNGEPPSHAMVEFRKPKLELGTFPTKNY